MKPGNRAVYPGLSFDFIKGVPLRSKQLTRVCCVSRLRQCVRPMTFKDVEMIAKIDEPEDRDAVIFRFAVGNAKSIGEARRTLAAENGGAQITVKDPVEEAFKALSAIWARAPKAAKRRFVDEHFEELGLLGADEEEARFEAARPVLGPDEVAF